MAISEIEARERMFKQSSTEGDAEDEDKFRTPLLNSHEHNGTIIRVYHNGAPIIITGDSNGIDNNDNEDPLND